eukprot:1161791-Pelagomonas_calceolata.AAC.8
MAEEKAPAPLVIHAAVSCFLEQEPGRQDARSAGLAWCHRGRYVLHATCYKSRCVLHAPRWLLKVQVQGQVRAAPQACKAVARSLGSGPLLAASCSRGQGGQGAGCGEGAHGAAAAAGRHLGGMRVRVCVCKL